MEIEHTLHPHALPDPHHRKIELQSPADLIYLQTNLLASARQKLDQTYPPLAAQQIKKHQPATVISLGGVKPASQTPPPVETQEQNAASEEEEDPMRAAVRAYVDAYISRIYSTASQSITVNGLDATSLPPTILTTKHPTPIPANEDTPASSGPREEEGVDFNYEAYDTRLQKQVADMYAELESLTVQVGQLRRTAPGKGADMMRQLLGERMKVEDEQFEKEIDQLRKEAANQEEREVLKLKALPDEWFEDRQKMYERGTSELSALAGLAGSGEQNVATATQHRPSLTETVGRVQRARTVAMEFE
ncbi:hypothetical protein H2200_011786 [Cladophialophora chaetospira]|uniref:Kinetochore protein mis14 n=1 Tax=Cladophialophora chaetospira TaxID=386627 RepID=A0AA38WYQ7_9EURO|nr:hypothetical protein H2200_011786 [Cladophialophora chaetospira]